MSQHQTSAATIERILQKLEGKKETPWGELVKSYVDLHSQTRTFLESRIKINSRNPKQSEAKTDGSTTHKTNSMAENGLGPISAQPHPFRLKLADAQDNLLGQSFATHVPHETSKIKG